jgi:hypothetical protein
MVVFGGKKVHQIVTGFGGSGLGQLALAVAVSFLVRIFSAPGPALLPENDDDDDDASINDGETPPSTGKVTPVTIRWNNINCSLSDKSSKSVSFYSFSFCKC